MSFFRRFRYRLTGRPYADIRKFSRYGQGVELAPNSEIYFPESIEMGDYCYVGPHACWYAEGGISIGRGVTFGPRTVIWTTNHDWRNADCLPYGMGNILGPVRIENFVWIGYGAMVLPGITIGEGAIVGMGSVITKDVEPLSVVAGNPARVVDRRDPDQYYRLRDADMIQLRQRYVTERRYRLKD